VNAGIDSDEFPTVWGKFDDTAEMIRTLPDGCLAATFDIVAAYRITPVVAEQQSALCIAWDGMVYVDRCAPFGLRSSAGVFGSIADMLVAIYDAQGFGPIRKWVDDFLVVRLPGSTWTEADFMALTAPLGVPWSIPKMRLLAEIQRYIGFDWNLRARSVSMPQEKLAATLAMVSAWITPGATSSEEEAARVHGKLVHLATIYPLVRPFLRSISRFASNFRSRRARLEVPSGARSDVKWILDIVPLLPRELPLATPDPIDIGWWGDASTSFGVGVVVGHIWGVWTWAPGVIVGPGHELHIGWAEAVAVELGLLLAEEGRRFEDGTRRISRVRVRSDNAGVVAVVNKGRARDRVTNDVLKRTYTSLARLGVTLAAEHVPGVINVADALSRGDVAGFLAAFPAARTRTSIKLPPALALLMTPYA
jgi:hypothetical protein